MWRPYKEAVEVVLPQAQLVVDKYHVVRMANTSLEKIRKMLREEMDPKQARTLKMYDRHTLLKRRRDLTEAQQLRLEVWTKNVPLLGQAYELKESFYTIWDTSDRRLALEQYQEWKNQIPSVLVPAFSELTTAIENWQTEIFAYFDYRLTNAYTESLNSLVQVIWNTSQHSDILGSSPEQLEQKPFTKRRGRMSFNVLRASILFGKELEQDIE